MSNTRIRFAPSPTGSLHIGSLRTVLFDYLIARSLGGKLILRIEDTDQKREVPGATKGLIEILEWVGIHFDEGPVQGGEYGPYIQSQRRDFYDQYKQELLDKGGAYPCFCSPERLDTMRKEQAEKKLPPRYDRCCRDLDPEEARRRIDAGEPYVIRQKMPLTGDVTVHDELRGDITFHAADLDDHVLIKTDGMPTYQFANVVDDHLMKITHVSRAEEWISSFPKNFLLYQAFGWTPPKFIHFTLVLNKEGGKLSKRQGDVCVEDYRRNGYLSEALINFCGLMGWHPKDDNEILSLDEIIKLFKYEDMGTSPAIFDTDKLDYFNGYYIRQLPINQLNELALPFLQDKMQASGKSPEYVKSVIALEQERLKKLCELPELTDFFFVDQPEYEPELLVWKKLTPTEVKTNLETVIELLEKVPAEEWTHHSTKDAVMTYVEAKELKIGDFLWPMRAALTGRKASPSPFEVAEVLGKEESLKRIRAGIEKLEVRSLK